MSEEHGVTIQEIVKWNGYFLIFLIFAVGMYWIWSSAVKKEIDTSSIANDIYISKFLEDSDCLAYNQNGVTNIGIIDVKKFNSGVLKSCLNRKGFSARLVLNYENKSMTAFNNEDVYILNSRLCFSSRYKCNSKKFYLLTVDQDKIYEATLDVSGVLDVIS